MDNDLDDFFAKKDKSRKKTKSKFTVDDILVAKKDIEDKSKKGKPSKKKVKDANQAEGAAGLKTEADDEEWVEIEDEAEKDYSGLRIQNLQITNKNDEDGKDNVNQREDGEDGESRDSVSGPWRAMGSSAPAPAPTASAAVTQTVPDTIDEPPKSTGRYVAPAFRNASGVSVSSGSKVTSRGKKSAPNVNSQEDFPTLGSAADSSEGPAFEKIRGGARQVDDPSGRHVKLSTGNKFDALNADDS